MVPFEDPWREQLSPAHYEQLEGSRGPLLEGVVTSPVTAFHPQQSVVVREGAAVAGGIEVLSSWAPHQTVAVGWPAAVTAASESSKAGASAAAGDIKRERVAARRIIICGVSLSCCALITTILVLCAVVAVVIPTVIKLTAATPGQSSQTHL